MSKQGVWIMAVSLIGCGRADGQQQEANAADNAVAPAPVAAAPPGPVTAQWLAGRWQSGGAPCSVQQSLFTFSPDGSYSLGSEQGRWSLSGSALTIEVTRAPDGHVTAGERHTSEIGYVGPDEGELRNAGIPPVRLQRCR